MNSRSIMICLTATGISSLLLFFYFKNKLSTVEDKLDSMFQLIQNYAAQSEKRSNEAQWRVQETEQSQPLVNTVQEVQHVNNSKIVVSDNDSEIESDSESEEDSDEESDEESVNEEVEEEEKKTVNQQSENKEETVKSGEEEEEEETGEDSLDGSEEGDSAEEDDEDDGEEDDDEEEEEDGEQVSTLETTTIELKMDDDEPEVKSVNVDTIDYDRMRVADLKNLARDRGLSGYRNLRKNDLIQLLSQ